MPSNDISLGGSPCLPIKMGLSTWAENRERVERMGVIWISPKILQNVRTQFSPRFCTVSMPLSPQCFERRKWVLWSEWLCKRMCPGAYPWLLLAPGHPSSPACRWEASREKDQRKTEDPGTRIQLQREKGRKRDSESNWEQQCSKKGF